MKIELEYDDKLINKFKENVPEDLYKDVGFEEWIKSYIYDSMFELITEHCPDMKYDGTIEE